MVCFELHKKSQPQNERSNTPDVRDVVGTTVLAIVCGFTRYVHINRLRNDTALAALLGLGRIVCEDSVRRRFLRSYANTRTRENGSTPEKGYNYAPKIHDERGKTWQNLGPGSIAKNSSGKVGDKFIERAIADNADAFFRILQDEAKKAGASL